MCVCVSVYVCVCGHSWAEGWNIKRVVGSDGSDADPLCRMTPDSTCRESRLHFTSSGYIEEYSTPILYPWISVFSTFPAGLCNVVGSLWYTTFDHFEYMFQSNCWYVLARHCSNSTQHKPLFTIMQRTGKTVDSPSYKKTIGIEMILTNEQRINVSNSMIRLGKERAQLLVDFPGNRVYGDSMITVKNGTTVSISAYEGTQHYLKVNIDYSLFGDYLRIVDVLVGPEYYNKTCGLCGTWNENSYDDTTVSPWSEWGRMRTQQFVEHYKEPSNQTCDLSFSETCSFNLTLTGEAISLCMMLLNNTQDSPFYECREALNRTGIPGTCVKDACVCLQDRKKSPAWCQCKALQPAKTYCAWNGHSTPVCSELLCCTVMAHDNAIFSFVR